MESCLRPVGGTVPYRVAANPLAVGEAAHLRCEARPIRELRKKLFVDKNHAFVKC
jgi:hypothetical protein